MLPMTFLNPGTFTVNVSADPSLAEEVAVFVTLILDSPVKTQLIPLDDRIAVGDDLVMTLAVFEGAAPIVGATITGSVITPNDQVSSMAFLDDGNGRDYVAEDGLYTGAYAASETGEYSIVTDTTGSTSLGTNFMRHDGAAVEVVAPTGTVDAANFDDYGEDLDVPFNGLYDRLVIRAQDVNVIVDGTYSLRVLLETQVQAPAEPQILVAFGEEDLTAVNNVLHAYVSAEEIQRVGYDGQYVIKSVELMYRGTDGLVTVDTITDGTQLTQVYNVDEFERPAIELLSVGADYVTDTDLDGDYDLLTVPLVVRVLSAGNYDFQATIDDMSCPGHIELIRGSQVLSNIGSEGIDLVFAGSLLGAHGVNGPYRLRDFHLWGPDDATDPSPPLIVNVLGDTQGYAVNQFDGHVVRPDCDSNGVPDDCELTTGAGVDSNTNSIPDSCDVSSGASLDCNTNLIPDECEVDCNTNTIPDDCDITVGTSIDCNVNGVPDECEVLVQPPTIPAGEAGWVKNRYVSVVPPTTPGLMALRVTLTDFRPTGNTPDELEPFEGQQLWVGQPQEYSEASGQGFEEPDPGGFDTFWSAELQCTPFYMDLSAMNVLHIRGIEIVPDGVYDVQAVLVNCDTALESNFSSALTVSTGRWGDVVGPLDGGAFTEPKGDINVTFDILALQGKFTGQPNSPMKVLFDLLGVSTGPGPVVDGKVTVNEILAGLSAFRNSVENVYHYPYKADTNGWGCPKN